MWAMCLRLRVSSWPGMSGALCCEHPHQPTDRPVGAAGSSNPGLIATGRMRRGVLAGFARSPCLRDRG
jgi:hypothetical protein